MMCEIKNSINFTHTPASLRASEKYLKNEFSISHLADFSQTPVISSVERNARPKEDR